MNYILMVLVPFVPSLLGLFGYYKVSSGKKKWKYPLIAVNAVIFVVAILLSGMEPLEVTIASTASIFSGIAGIATLLASRAKEKLWMNALMAITMNLILLAYGFVLAVLKWVIM